MHKTYHILILIILLSFIVNATNVNYKNKKIRKKYCKKCLQQVEKRKLMYCNKCPILENAISLNLISPEKLFDTNSKWSSAILLSNYTKFDYNKIKNLIVFGDSHSAVSTNFTNMSYTGNGHTGGKNWSIYLSEFNKMKLWNFATYGAVVDSKITYHRNNTIDFLKQYELFYERMSNGKKYFNEWNKYNTLIAIFMGTNDVHHLNQKCKSEQSIFCAKNNKTINENINNITDIIFEIINKFYNIRARNILILTPLNKPYIFNINHYSTNNTSIFNNNMINKSIQFFEKHNDTNFIIYNPNNEIKNIVTNCNKYNFKDCKNMWKDNKTDNLTDYLWVDSHLSEVGNKYLTEDINDLLNSLSQQTNSKRRIH